MPKNTSAKSNRPSEATSLDSSATDAKLSAWLDAQAAKLKTLETKASSLKYNFALNAKRKGDILLEVRKRLSQTPKGFERWVTESAGIGYSTALLWIDVAENFFDVNEQIADSNPLELTLRQIRDAIRDARQKRGEGKPGSGRRKPKATETPNDGDVADNTEIEAENTDIEDDVEEATRTSQRWENAAAAAEAEAAGVAGVEENEAKPQHYKVLVTVANEGDQATIHAALSNWSATSIMPIGTKQVRSVSANVRTNAIGTALQRLGQALETNPPKAVKVSVEL